MHQAFAIFVASEFQQLFVHAVGGAIFGLPLDNWSTLWGFSIWLAIAYAIDPLTRGCLQRFSNNGARSRSYLEAGLLTWAPHVGAWRFPRNHTPFQ